MTQPQEHSVDWANCVKEVHHIGRTAYHNVCNGKIAEVPWGAVDWILAVSLASVLTFAALALLVITFLLIREHLGLY